jgi:hypothetical protein
MRPYDMLRRAGRCVAVPLLPGDNYGGFGGNDFVTRMCLLLVLGVVGHVRFGWKKSGGLSAP